MCACVWCDMCGMCDMVCVRMCVVWGVSAGRGLGRAGWEQVKKYQARDHEELCRPTEEFKLHPDNNVE